MTFEAIICFGPGEYPNPYVCEIFDGNTPRTFAEKTIYGHRSAGLGFYKGRLTAVGGAGNWGGTETLLDNRWKELSGHPR